MVGIGELVARGRTSDVYAYGGDEVAKVLRIDVPDEWALMEAEHTRAVRMLGLSVPAVEGVIEIDGRPAVVFQRIIGPSMWELMVEDSGRVPELVGLMAAIQRDVHSAGLPDSVPGLLERVSAKIADVKEIDDAEREAALALLAEMPFGSALLHGDLHPGNVLMSSDGPVVIDWFDASIGHPDADIVRTLLLLFLGTASEASLSLPGASAPMLREVHDQYARAIGWSLPSTAPVRSDWERLVALSRLAENVDEDRQELLRRWRA